MQYKFSIVGFSGSQTDCTVKVKVAKEEKEAFGSFYFYHEDGKEDHFHFHGDWSTQMMEACKEWFVTQKPNQDFCAKHQVLCHCAACNHTSCQMGNCKDCKGNSVACPHI